MSWPTFQVTGLKELPDEITIQCNGQNGRLVFEPRLMVMFNGKLTPPTRFQAMCTGTGGKKFRENCW